jgi:hypothetical protein
LELYKPKSNYSAMWTDEKTEPLYYALILCKECLIKLLIIKLRPRMDKENEKETTIKLEHLRCHFHGCSGLSYG